MRSSLRSRTVRAVEQNRLSSPLATGHWSVCFLSSSSFTFREPRGEMETAGVQSSRTLVSWSRRRNRSEEISPGCLCSCFRPIAGADRGLDSGHTLSRSESARFPGIMAKYDGLVYYWTARKVTHTQNLSNEPLGTEVTRVAKGHTEWQEAKTIYTTHRANAGFGLEFAPKAADGR